MELAYRASSVLMSAASNHLAEATCDPPPPTESRRTLIHTSQCPDPYATAPRRDPTATARQHHHTSPRPHTPYRRLRVACPTSRVKLKMY